MHPKKIIFIAGADHSGSTLVGAILGADNTPFRYFHVGELHAFFSKDFRKKNNRFGDPKEAINMPGGEIWDKIDHTVGYENAYEEIFLKTNADVIIDSSKTPQNLSVCLSACAKKGYSVYVIVTFRPFAKIWNSGLKRSKEHIPADSNSKSIFAKLRSLSFIQGKDEKRIMKNLNRYFWYKKMFMQNGKKHCIINLESLILDPPGMTKVLCKETGIPYFQGKEKYWNFPACHLYGSRTQRLHYNKPENAGFNAQKVMNTVEISASFLKKKKVQLIEEFLKSNAMVSL